MTTLRQQQLKQLNYLDKAITNLTKAVAVGEKQEELGYNNGRIALRAKELLDIYNEQFEVSNVENDDYDGPGVNDYEENSFTMHERGVF